MKKPHMVKKCAMPATFHLSSRVWANTSSTCVMMRVFMSFLRAPSSMVVLPDEIRLTRKRMRFTASSPTTRVATTPMIIVTNTNGSTARLPE
jgi:hypothetical protein